jgi:hypothetical protein
MEAAAQVEALLREAFVTVTMILCMNCAAPSGDGFTVMHQWPTMEVCERAARKIDRTWPSAVPICLLDAEVIQAGMYQAKQNADMIERGEIARDVCEELGGLRQYPDLAVCMYHYGGPVYRKVHDEPPGYIPIDNPND